MNFGQAIASGFKNYANFNGRAARSEFWYWYLFNFLVMVIPAIWYSVEQANKQVGFGSVLYFIVILAVLLPTIAMQVRRLHDTNRSGGWWWIQLVPFAGGIIMLVFMLLPSVDQSNRFNK